MDQNNPDKPNKEYMQDPSWLLRFPGVNDRPTRLPTPVDLRDGLYGQFGDMIDGDRDGRIVIGCDSFEMMDGASVRILIDPTAPREEILALLHKIVGQIEDDTASGPRRTCDNQG